MSRTLPAVLCLSIALLGCKAKEMFDKADISKDLKSRGTTDLMKQAAEDSYDAPSDGKLTEAQVRMYLKVREHEKKIAQVAKEELKQHSEKADKAGEKSLSGMMAGFKALGSVADVLTADIRAAKDLGYNSQEYLWVKGQILEVSGAAMAEKMGEAMSAGLDSAYAQAKKALADSKDETTKQMYAEMVKGYEQQLADMKKQAQEQLEQNPALAHNRQLVSKFGSELNAIADEFAKFSDKPEADTKKAVADWEKEVQKAKADAQKNQ
jgi:hypothetical protein